MATVPPAPALSPFTLLSVFVHVDALPLVQASQALDGPRFRALGERVLLAAYSDMIFRRRTDLRDAQLQDYIDQEYPIWLDHWVTAYTWRTTMTAVPDGVNLNDAEETKKIFDTYAGAVMAERGWAVLLAWIATLVVEDATIVER